MNNVELWKKLEACNVKKDTALPVWCFEVENIIVENQRYLKIWLVNRLVNSKAINRVFINYEGKEYIASDFKISSVYKNENVIGCVVPIEIEQTSKEIEITKEIIGGETFEAEKKYIDYKHTEAPDVDFEYVKKVKGIKGDMYPHLDKKYWQCTCGAINNKGKTCHCGNNEGDIADVISFDIKGSKITDHLMVGIKYNLNKSFEENINEYCKSFETNTGYEESNIREGLDLVKEEEKYNILLEEKKIQDDKNEVERKQKAKKTKIFVGILVLAATICIGLCAIFKDDITYSGCKAKTTVNERIDCYYSVKDTKDAKEKINKEFKAYVTELSANGQNQAVIDAFGQYDEKVDAYAMVGRIDPKEILDDELKNIYIDALYKLGKDETDAAELSSYLQRLNKYTNKYDDEFNNLIYSAYERKIGDGSKEVVNYFYKQYKSGNIHCNDGYGYVNLQKALHYYVSACSVKDKCQAWDALVTNYGWKSIKEFYKDLKAGGYSSAILDDQCYDATRLLGSWSGSGRYFSMSSDGDISYNLPWFSYGDYYVLYNHYITLHSNSSSSTKDLFKITFIDNNCVKFYCYDNHSTYYLYK